ncbi:MAG: DUF374 domain-containing protein [Leptospirales bacterium]
MGYPKNRASRFCYKASTSLVSSVSSITLGLYQATLNIDFEGKERLLKLDAEGTNYIIAVWHTFVDVAVLAFHSRRLLIYSDHPRLDAYEKSSAHFFREVGIKTLRSHGFDVLDASHTKQSVGILNFIRKIKEGCPALIAPDGPNGPIYEAKPGSVYMAAKTGSVIVPVGISVSRQITGPNWDDFAVPIPFSKIIAVIGEPIKPPQKPDAKVQQEYTYILENSLDALCHQANTLL